VKGFQLSVSCPRCGGLLVHRCSEVTSVDRGWAEVWCEVCLIVWRIDVCATAVRDHSHLNDDDTVGRRQRASAALTDEAMSVMR
jgi:hypothetical protein